MRLTDRLTSAVAVERWAELVRRGRPRTILPGVPADEQALLPYASFMAEYGILPPERRLWLGFTSRDFAVMLLAFILPTVFGLPLRWAAALGVLAGVVIRFFFPQRSARQALAEIRATLARNPEAEAPPEPLPVPWFRLSVGERLVFGAFGVWMFVGGFDGEWPLFALGGPFVFGALTGCDPLRQ